MIESILYIIMCWLLTGFLSGFFLIFVFFRGPIHLISCYLYSKDKQYNKSGIYLLKMYAHYGIIKFLIIYLFALTMVGIFSTLTLIIDYFYFTFSQNKT